MDDVVFDFNVDMLYGGAGRIGFRRTEGTNFVGSGSCYFVGYAVGKQ